MRQHAVSIRDAIVHFFGSSGTSNCSFLFQLFIAYPLKSLSQLDKLLTG